jgi:hypothetical protein
MRGVARREKQQCHDDADGCAPEAAEPIIEKQEHPRYLVPRPIKF